MFNFMRPPTTRFRIKKSRYDSIDSYISDGPMYKAKYNDIDLVYDHDVGHGAPGLPRIVRTLELSNLPPPSSL